MHARWMAYLQKFVFTVHHKAGVKNQVADALSRRAHNLTILKMSIPAFECLKELYPQVDDLKKSLE